MDLEKNIVDFFKKSWDIFIKNFVALIIATLIACIGSILLITIAPLFYGLYLMSADLIKGKKISYSDVFNGFNHFFRSWGIALLAAISVGLGLVLLVIPGILLMIMFQYAASISVLENKGAVDSLQKSFGVAKKNFALSLVLFLLMMILNGIGGALWIGTVLTAPFSALVLTAAAQKLKN